MSISLRKINYQGWQNCHRLGNGVVDLVLTTDVGPRIIRFGFVGEENEFKEYEDQLGRRGGSDWRIYGGHRLWHAPEEQPRTYFPDNTSVKLERQGSVVRLIQPVESTTGIQKEIDLRLSPNRAEVNVIHRLRNTNPWAVEIAPWALTVMRPGGTAIIPLPPRGSHPEDLPPGNNLTLWKYTDMSDPRWTWGRQYILLRQDTDAGLPPQKIGATVTEGWAAYARAGHLFLKTFRHDLAANYPDLGSSFETFTNNEMLELETLGPLATLTPGATVEHIEQWRLFRDVPMPRSDRDVKAHVLPQVRQARKV